MKYVKRKEEGVSPVIATILLVAITVVLVATLLVMLPTGTTGGTTLTASLTYDPNDSDLNNNKAVFKVSMSNPSSIDPAKVNMVLVDTTGATTALTYVTDPSTLDANNTGWSFQDLNANGKLDTGDKIIVVHSSVASGAKITLSITGYTGNAEGVIP